MPEASAALCAEFEQDTKVKKKKGEKQACGDRRRPHGGSKAPVLKMTGDFLVVFQDCLSAITDFFNEKLHIIGYIGIGIAGVMVRIRPSHSYSRT